MEVFMLYEKIINNYLLFKRKYDEILRHVNRIKI